MEMPETRYAKTADGVHIAYQVVGNGPIDLVYVSGWISNVDLNWSSSDYAHFLKTSRVLLPAHHLRQARRGIVGPGARQ